MGCRFGPNIINKIASRELSMEEWAIITWAGSNTQACLDHSKQRKKKYLLGKDLQKLTSDHWD